MLRNFLQWKSFPELVKVESVALLKCLKSPFSMTRYMEELGKEPLTVSLLAQNWRRLFPEESLSLHIPLSETGWVREVILGCRGESWMFARTVFPRKFLTGREKRYQHLNNKPLGRWLFSEPSFARGCFEYALIDKSAFVLSGATQLLALDERKLWARRSRILVQNKPILLSEVFLPSFLKKLL